MFRFLNRLKRYWPLVVLLVLLTMLQVACDFCIPAVLGEIIGTLQGSSSVKHPGQTVDTGYILRCAAMMVTFAIGSGLTAISVGKISSFLTAKMMSQVRYDLYEKIGKFSVTEMSKFSTSSLITRTTNDITNIINTYSFVFRYGLYAPLTTIAALVFLIRLNNWPMFGLTMGAVIVIILFLVFIIKIVLPKFNQLQGKVDHVNLVTKENLEGLRVIRAYNAEEYQAKKFENINDDLMRTDRFANRGLNSIMPVIQVVIGFLSVGIAWIGSFLIFNKSMQFSDMAVVSEYSILLLTGFIMMTYIFTQMPRSLICGKRINEVLDTEIDVQDAEKTGRQTEVGTVEFKDVTFCYPGSEIPAIEHISFKVNKGETIAFIGATGSGKSTLINLIPRFSDATSGQVLVDGNDVKNYKLDDLFVKIGYVPQKGYLFHKTLRENVCLGRPNATEEQFQRALEISQSKEFVEKLPHKDQYEISQGGKNVSGGQRQRLSIARAIIMEPEIFIFDDSFSALDYRTDKILRGEIKDKCKGATCVIVAQRVGTIIDADQIIVLDNGKMVGKGTHKELLKNCAVYQEIALSQLSKEELEK